MTQRGRKSSASNVVALRSTPERPRLIPPSTLNAHERAIFIETATGHPHLKAGDVMVLAAFAQASVRSCKLAKKPDTKQWEIATRTMLALARALRLTPISQTRPDVLGRKRDSAQPSYYETMDDDDD